MRFLIFLIGLLSNYVLFSQKQAFFDTNYAYGYVAEFSQNHTNDFHAFIKYNQNFEALDSLKINWTYDCAMDNEGELYTIVSETIHRVDPEDWSLDKIIYIPGLKAIQFSEHNDLFAISQVANHVTFSKIDTENKERVEIITFNRLQYIHATIAGLAYDSHSGVFYTGLGPKILQINLEGEVTEILTLTVNRILDMETHPSGGLYVLIDEYHWKSILAIDLASGLQSPIFRENRIRDLFSLENQESSTLSISPRKIDYEPLIANNSENLGFIRLKNTTGSDVSVGSIISSTSEIIVDFESSFSMSPNEIRIVTFKLNTESSGGKLSHLLISSDMGVDTVSITHDAYEFKGDQENWIYILDEDSIYTYDLIQDELISKTPAGGKIKTLSTNDNGFLYGFVGGYLNRIDAETGVVVPARSIYERSGNRLEFTYFDLIASSFDRNGNLVYAVDFEPPGFNTDELGILYQPLNAERTRINVSQDWIDGLALEPQGRSLYYFYQNTLYNIDLDGSHERSIVSFGNGELRSIFFNENGVLYALVQEEQSQILYEVNRFSGEMARVAEINLDLQKPYVAQSWQPGLDEQFRVLGVNASELTYFPNPFSQEFSIRSTEFIEEITVYDMTGRQVYKKIPQEPEPSIRLDFEAQPGTYLLVSRLLNGEVITNKIVKR